MHKTGKQHYAFFESGNEMTVQIKKYPEPVIPKNKMKFNMYTK